MGRDERCRDHRQARPSLIAPAQLVHPVNVRDDWRWSLRGPRLALNCSLQEVIADKRRLSRSCSKCGAQLKKNETFLPIRCSGWGANQTMICICMDISKLGTFALYR